jgi:hypothetical protein
MTFISAFCSHFPRPYWVREGAKTVAKRSTIKGHSTGSFPAEFWQTGQFLNVFFTGTENERFTGFPGRGRDRKNGIGALYGRLFPKGRGSSLPDNLPLSQLEITRGTGGLEEEQHPLLLNLSS